MNDKKTPKTPIINSDTIFRIVPIVISIIALIVTLKNNVEQDKKWRYANLGKIEITDVRHFSYGEYTLQEIKSINWGYNPILLDITNQSSQSFKYQNTVNLVNCVTAKNKKTYEYVKYPSLKTVGDMHSFLSRRGKLDTTDWVFFRHFRIIICLENIGGTACKILSQAMGYEETFIPIKDAYNVENGMSYMIGKNPISLGSHQKTYTNFEADFLFDQPTPNKYFFEISYEDSNKNIQKMKVHLEFDENGWSIISG